MRARIAWAPVSVLAERVRRRYIQIQRMKMAFILFQDPTVLVCICKGLSDRRIREEIRRGCTTLRSLQQSCGAGTDCGQCARQVRSMIDTTARTHARDAGEHRPTMPRT
ncbi:MAG: hypothetical protein B7733_25495 [Myxococcales bacterium FL481]|nr:MAG: hypothetical protein B7733_25495 [Myxococcales bacterium FL481]